MDSGVSPVTKQQYGVNVRETKKEGYIHRVLVAFDIFVNVVCGGVNDETISSRSGRAAREGKLWGKVMAHFLNLFQPDHCEGAFIGDLKRAKTVEAIEESAIQIKE